MTSKEELLGMEWKVGNYTLSIWNDAKAGYEVAGNDCIVIEYYDLDTCSSDSIPIDMDIAGEIAQKLWVMHGLWKNAEKGNGNEENG